MRKLQVALLWGLMSLTSVRGLAQDGSPDSSLLEPYRQAAVKQWEEEIRSLEHLDRVETDPADGILLVGSSSIRLWKNAAVDMAPYRTIRRGYGGARYSDLAVFAERIIRPHAYRALVLFAANDVLGTPEDPTLDEVEKLVRYIIAASRRHQPGAAVFVVEVTPTLRRWEAWPRIRALNARLREVTQTEADTYFVATADHYLDSRDQPVTSLFGEDQLHQNEAGYAVWSELIRRRLDEVFRMMGRERVSY